MAHQKFWKDFMAHQYRPKIFSNHSFNYYILIVWSLMVDWGFLIKDYLKPLGVGLEIPNFLKGRDRFMIKETVKSQQIANGRMSKEWYNIWNVFILTGYLLINMLRPLNQIISVCVLLSNFQEPILKKT